MANYIYRASISSVPILIIKMTFKWMNNIDLGLKMYVMAFAFVNSSLEFGIELVIVIWLVIISSYVI